MSRLQSCTGFDSIFSKTAVGICQRHFVACVIVPLLCHFSWIVILSGYSFQDNQKVFFPLCRCQHNNISFISYAIFTTFSICDHSFSTCLTLLNSFLFLFFVCFFIWCPSIIFFFAFSSHGSSLISVCILQILLYFLQRSVNKKMLNTLDSVAVNIRIIISCEIIKPAFCFLSSMNKPLKFN